MHQVPSIIVEPTRVEQDGDDEREDEDAGDDEDVVDFFTSEGFVDEICGGD